MCSLFNRRQQQYNNMVSIILPIILLCFCFLVVVPTPIHASISSGGGGGISSTSSSSRSSSTGSPTPYRLGIRDTFMIAHSFHHRPQFGIAGGMHGATYTCEVEFGCKQLDPDSNWVIDIGYASDLLTNQILKKYNFQNLDELFGPNILTTTEFMCEQIWNDLRTELQKEYPTFHGSICVTLWESHKAWASFTGDI